MDPALKEAAKMGDVKFLKEAFSIQPSEYSLTQTPKDEGQRLGGNIFHLAAWNNRVEFVGEAANIDGKGFSILHQWAEKGDVGPCKLLLEGDGVGDARAKIFKECIFRKENQGFDTPLHIAARKKDSELAQIWIHGYQQQIPSIDPSSCKICNNKGESPFFLAVRSGCALAVDEIMKIEEPRFHMLLRNDGTTVIHSLSSCPEETGRTILEKYWWVINSRDNQGKTALDYAKQANVLWPVSLLTNPSLIQKEEFDWIEACKREETLAVLAFVDNCQDLQRAYREENDTPLHHVILVATHKDYFNFLKIPSIAELKNTTDHDGATPLHRALERKDMLLAKILLLDGGVERTIADHNGGTSMDLLAELCKDNDDWPIPIYISFAAGFTLPGGIDSSGEAVLAKKTAFLLVFLLADVYAMCTSMLVLFCLIWSMVSEPDMARLLVDHSVFILMQSLYGTLLAFMTGVYTVIAYRSLWAAILIFVMCAIIEISANRTILHSVIAKLVPAASREKVSDQMCLLEEGRLMLRQVKRIDKSITS
ncbi:uncharacterized protein LOC141655086 [Silene latifolia]|uniref:uncharacterized protein LOC141655086 n=1 Tax=Silene latifolia TaxID=37657 RepID=UPI003D7843C1